MLKGTRHAMNLGRLGPDLAGHLAPLCDGLAHSANDLPRAGQRQPEKRRRAQYQFQRTGAFIQVDVGGEDACLQIHRGRVQIVGR